MSERAAAAALGLLLLAGCARTDAPPAPSPQRPVAAPLIEAPAADPASYVARAASYDQLMVRAGYAVAERSRDGELLRLAGGLSADHRGLAAQLSMAGRRINLLPRTQLLPNHQLWLDEMLRAPDPEGAYCRLARRVHQNSYVMHARFADRGSSPTLRLVARNAAQTERRHWAELQR